MLNVNEIRSLENRWKKYKRRRLYKYLGFTVLLVLIFLAPIVFWNKSFIHTKHNKHFLEKKHLSKNKIPKKKEEKAFNFLEKEKNISSKVSIDKSIAKDNNFTKKTDNTIQRKIDNQQNLDRKQVVKSIKNRSSLLTLDQSFLKHIYIEKRYSNQYEEASGNINKNYSLSTNYSDKNSEKSLENSLKTNKEDDINSKKPKVIISAKKIDKINYYKRRYIETKKVLYAVLLAKEYYNKKKYDKSLKWAIEANNIDSNNIESWIYFAKSNVKLGRKEDAINALKAYLKFHTSKEVEVLLKNIQSGIFK